METHDADATTNSGEEPDSWAAFAAGLDELKMRLAATYRKAANNHGPSEDEVKAAIGTLAAAWGQVAESVGAALEDPDLRGELKSAATSFATAFGATIRELGDELSTDRDRTTETEPPGH